MRIDETDLKNRLTELNTVPHGAIYVVKDEVKEGPHLVYREVTNETTWN